MYQIYKSFSDCVFQLFFIFFATENVDAKEKILTNFSDFWIIVTQKLDYQFFHEFFMYFVFE